MKVEVKIINDRLREQMPAYATTGSAGLDLRAMLDEALVLQPGETKTVCFEVAAEELAFAKNDAKWYLEKGSYTVQCGQLVEKLTCLEDASLGEHI